MKYTAFHHVISLQLSCIRIKHPYFSSRDIATIILHKNKAPSLFKVVTKIDGDEDDGSDAQKVRLK